MKGRFISLEGIEGCGKSTQSALLARHLESEGVPVLLTHEPGGTSRGTQIRSLLLDPASGPLDERAEALLYAADRAIHVSEVLRPALTAGQWVVCDRYADSYRAYQGFGRGLDLGEVSRLSSWSSCGLEPDLVVILDLDVEVGRSRITGDPDRMEQEEAAFHERVRRGFLELAAAEPDRFRIVKGDQEADAVAQSIWEAVASALEV